MFINAYIAIYVIKKNSLIQMYMAMNKFSEATNFGSLLKGSIFLEGCLEQVIVVSIVKVKLYIKIA